MFGTSPSWSRNVRGRSDNSMNLINELENDLARAILSEGRFAERLESREMVDLMARVRRVLKPISSSEDDLHEILRPTAKADNAVAH